MVGEFCANTTIFCRDHKFYFPKHNFYMLLDRDVINPEGLKATGPEELKIMFQCEFDTNFGMSDYAIRIYSVKELSSDLKVADWDCTLSVCNNCVLPYPQQHSLRLLLAGCGGR